LNVGDKLTLIATVTAGAAQTNRGVTWASGNSAVATVNATTGEVTAIGAGTTNIVATSAADSSIKAATSVTVVSTGSFVRITAINQDGQTAVLSNVSGRVDVVVSIPAGPPSYSTIDLIMNCAGTDTVVATQSATATMSTEQSITLSFNTAGFKNGPCALKLRATTSTGLVVASSAIPITLNNPTTASASRLGAEYPR
jgi:uncharacterized protein YjdB